ncbi:MAG: D-alanine--D-alanine ligase [Lachnospiraceae bacterium]|nr:D-alanine--D-alanine ligase [Lachnospiraceae bacterium]
MKTNIAVFFGGMSTEHEVSIISAIQAMENIDKDKYDLTPIYIGKDGDFYYHKDLFYNSANFKDIQGLLKQCKKVTFVKNGEKVYLIGINDGMFSKTKIEIDIAFPIVHGTNVEDGNLQGYIHTLGLPMVGCSCLASALGMDKYVMKKYLEAEKIPVIDGISIDINDYKKLDETIDMIEKRFAYPVIIKPVDLGSSIGISKASNREKLKESLELAFSFANIVIVEKAIVNLREINCSVVGDKFDAEASILEEPFGKDEILSYKDKYMSGGSKGSKGAKVSGTKTSAAGGTKGGMASLQRKIPAELSKDMEDKIRELAVKTFKVLRCSGVSRIDFIIDKDDNKIYVNEINTIPGSLSFYLWEPAGLPYKELLNKLVNIALKEKRRENELKYTFEDNILR